MKDKCLLDFEYLYNALKKHPSFQREDKLPEYETISAKLRSRVQGYTSLVNAMTELTMFFGDGHTNIEIPYSNDDYCIKLDCEWQGDSLILKEKYEDVEAGAEIKAIEGMKIEQVLERAALLIPHENIYLVKSRMTEYPYINYHIFSEMNLSRLYGRKSSYRVTFKRENAEFEKQCELVKYDGFIDFQDNNFIHYEIQGNRAVLHLDGCVYDDEYKKKLAELAKLCKQNSIEILELDLSKNMGGNSLVIDEFISYVDVASFRHYEMIDYSEGSPQIVCSRKNIARNCKKEILFPHKIVCRVSNTTFSSARTFAVTLKDNHIATIIGQPTGGKPCSYGMPRRDSTPNYNIRFRVSRCLFLRPDDSLDDEITLFPADI